VFSAEPIKNLPLEHAFTCDFVGTREVLDTHFAGGVGDEVLAIWAETARGAGVNYERDVPSFREGIEY
jgi:hypothetical protein